MTQPSCDVRPSMPATSFCHCSLFMLRPLEPGFSSPFCRKAFNAAVDHPMQHSKTGQALRVVQSVCCQICITARCATTRLLAPSAHPRQHHSTMHTLAGAWQSISMSHRCSSRSSRNVSTQLH